MNIAYVSGPYRAKSLRGVIRNIRAAEAVAIELWQMGYAVICPHKNTALFDGVCKDSVWLKGDLEFIKRLDPDKDCIVMVGHYQRSHGAMEEARQAKTQGLEIYIWPEDREQMRNDA